MSAEEHETIGPNVVPWLKVIEGGRSIEGNDVLARFADETQELSIETKPMAGYAVVVWDDEGNFSTAIHIGARTPFSPMMLPKFASDLVKSKVVTQ